MVDDAGYQFWAGSEPPETFVGPIREKLPIVPAGEASVLGNRELFGRLAATAMLPAMEEVLASWRPDLVLRDPCEYASAVAAPPLGIAMAQVAIGLAEVERASIAVAAPALEDHRRGLVSELMDAPYMTRFPASLDPSPFADTRRFSEPPTTAVRLPDWWSGSIGPLVYVSLGTVLGHMSLAGEVYQTLLDALGGLDARILLTTGHKFDRTQLVDVPGNVHIEAWIDQKDVLPHADLVVCHGGSGTTFAALGAGVPVVIVPIFADQFANARRVEMAGAGLVTGRDTDGDGLRTVPGATDAARIRWAVDNVLAGDSYRSAARTIAAEMASAPDLDTVLRDLLHTD